jgi:site-specific DNA-methyltransferase (adenine-specific)
MTTAHYAVGDTRDLTAVLPDGCIDLILTSPPFLALRSYLPADHPDKAREIGSEANPAAFIDVLLALTAEWGRVLAPHGSIAIELGDTYAGGGQGPDPGKNPGKNDVATVGKSRGEGWPLAKSLALIPEMYRIGLAYGINPLTGQPSPAGRWRVRNVVRWHRPNPPVGALGDKYRPATTDMVIATRAKDRWFDLDAVRHHNPRSDETDDRAKKNRGHPDQHVEGVLRQNPAGAPPLDTWIIPTEPYAGAHYATWPRRLCEVPIKSMCPLEVCRLCGTPRRRITGYSDEYAAHRLRSSEAGTDMRDRRNTEGHRVTGRGSERMDAEHLTLGWTDCGCDTPNYQPGVVLDPFAGSGTTLAVATGHGRHALGFDLDARNLDLARERVGMFLTDGPEHPDWINERREVSP